MPTNPNDSAWPLPSDAKQLNKKGMTKLEEFTKAAMQGLLSQPGHHEPWVICSKAVQIARAQIAELNKPTEENHDKSSD